MNPADALTADDLDFAAIACGRASLLPHADYMAVIAAKLFAEADRRRAREPLAEGNTDAR